MNIFYDEDEKRVKIHKNCDDEDYLKVLQHYYSILDTESEEIFNKCNIDNILIKKSIYDACLESDNEEKNEEKLNSDIKQNNIKEIPKPNEENNNIFKKLANNSEKLEIITSINDISAAINNISKLENIDKNTSMINILETVTNNLTTLTNNLIMSGKNHLIMS